MKSTCFRKRIVLTAVIAAMMSCVLTACGSSANSQYNTVAEDTGYYAADDQTAQYSSSNGIAAGKSMASAEYVSDAGNGVDAASQESSVTSGEDTEQVTRKLVKTVYLSAETEDLDSFETSLNKQVSDVGGYIESSSISNGNGAVYYDDPSYSSSSSKTRYGSYTIRIPADQLDSFVAQVSGETNVLSQSTNVDDITLQYVDNQSKIDALKIEQQNLMDMLEKAETVEDMIAIQAQLTTVNADLQSYQSQQNYYDNQVDYATLNVDVTEVQKYTPAVEKDTPTRIKEGLEKNWQQFLINLREFAIWFVSNLPYIIFWVVFAIIVIAIIKAIRRHSKKYQARKAAKAEAKAEARRIKQEAKKAAKLAKKGVKPNNNSGSAANNSNGSAPDAAANSSGNTGNTGSYSGGATNSNAINSSTNDSSYNSNNGSSDSENGTGGSSNE